MGIGTSLKKLRKKADIGKVEGKAARFDKKAEEKIGMGPVSAAESVLGLHTLPAKEETYKQTVQGVKSMGSLIDQNKFAIIGGVTGGYKGAAAGAGADKRGVLTYGQEEDEEETIAPPIALPDEELQRSARRKARGKRRGGRSSSILTGGALG